VLKFVYITNNQYLSYIKEKQSITIKRYTIMATKKMSDKVKGSLIAQIMSEMKSVAILQNKPFDEGIFFDLIFMSDKELLKVSRLCGIK
jgi:hypothetical protein